MQLVVVEQAADDGVALQRVRDLRVQPGPPGRAGGPGDGVAGQRVGEGVVAGVLLDHQPGNPGVLEVVEHLVGVEPAGRGDGRGLEAAAGDGGQPERVERARRAASVRRRVTTSRTVAGTSAASGSASRASSTRKNGLPAARRCQASAVSSAIAAPATDRTRARASASVEPGEVEPQRVAAGEGLADLRQRAGRLRMGAPGRHDHAAACRARSPRARGAGCAGSRRRPSAGRRAERAPGLVGGRGRAPVAIRSEVSNACRAALASSVLRSTTAARSVSAVGIEGAQDPEPRPQRRRPVVLRAGAARDDVAASPRLVGQVVGEPGLADAGLPDQQGAGPGADRRAGRAARPARTSRPTGRPSAPPRLAGATARRAADLGDGAGSVVERGRAASRPGCRIARSRSRSSAPGSSPSSSASSSRTARRRRAPPPGVRRGSGRGRAAPTTAPAGRWWPPATRWSTGRSRARRARAARAAGPAPPRRAPARARSAPATTSGCSSRSAYGVPVQVASAASSSSRVALRRARPGQPARSPVVSWVASGASTRSSRRTPTTNRWASTSSGRTRRT